MISKIKEYLVIAAGLVIAVLSALLFASKRKTENLESELAHEKVDNNIRSNENERKIARDNADALVSEYERLKRDE